MNRPQKFSVFDQFVCLEAREIAKYPQHSNTSSNNVGLYQMRSSVSFTKEDLLGADCEGYVKLEDKENYNFADE